MKRMRHDSLGASWLLTFMLCAFAFFACETPTGSGDGDDGENDPGTTLDRPIAAAAAVDASSIAVAWNPVSGATSYCVYRSLDDSQFDCISDTLSANFNSYTDTGLAAATRYYYRVAGKNASGIGPVSVSCSAQTFSAPNSVSISSVEATVRGSLTVKWQSVAEAISYKLYRDTDAGGTFETIAADMLSTTEYSDTGLADDTYYFYRIQTVGLWGTSEKSAALGARTLPALPPPPATPAAPSASRGSTTSTVSLSWTSVAGADAYRIYRYQSFDSPTSATKISGADISGTSYTDSTALSGYDYYYYVGAVGPGGESAKSPGSIGYTRMPTPIGMSASTYSSSYVYLSWTSVSRVYEYRIYKDGSYLATTMSAFYYDYPSDTSTHTYRVTAVGNSIYRRLDSESAQSTSASGRKTN